MTNWEKEKERFEKIGLITNDVPMDVLHYLKSNDKKTKMNNKLVGHIKKEYAYLNIPPYVSNFFLSNIDLNHPYTAGLLKKYKVMTQDKTFTLASLWVNYQKKHEFNPFHNHAGIFSFIVFLKIPYDLSKEEKKFPDTNSRGYASKLAFYLTDSVGDIGEELISVDKSFEGKMVMFPAKMNHIVYPFYTSNDYRITVSGNILFDVGV